MDVKHLNFEHKTFNYLKKPIRIYGKKSIAKVKNTQANPPEYFKITIIIYYFRFFFYNWHIQNFIFQSLIQFIKKNTYTGS